MSWVLNAAFSLVKSWIAVQVDGDQKISPSFYLHIENYVFISVVLSSLFSLSEPLFPELS